MPPAAHVSSADRLDLVEAIIFDLDGTLIDTIDLIRTSMRHATHLVLGAPLPDEILMRNVGVPLIVQMREFDEERAEELLLAYRAHNSEVHDELVAEYPGVEAALTSLAQRYRLAIVTSKSAPVARRGLDRFGLAHFFEHIVTYDDVPVHKPDPYPLVHTAGLLGTPIERCAYVGDSPHDMTAAVAAGCVSVAALWGGFTKERVLEPGPMYATKSMTDVVALFNGDEALFRV